MTLPQFTKVMNLCRLLVSRDPSLASWHPTKSWHLHGNEITKWEQLKPFVMLVKVRGGSFFLKCTKSSVRNMGLISKNLPAASGRNIFPNQFRELRFGF